MYTITVIHVEYSSIRHLLHLPAALMEMRGREASHTELIMSDNLLVVVQAPQISRHVPAVIVGVPVDVMITETMQWPRDLLDISHTHDVDLVWWLT